MMQRNDSETLFRKYQSGLCSPEEQKIVEHWLTYGDFQEFDLSEKELSDDLNAIQDRIELHMKRKQLSLWPRITVAASVAICLSAGVYFFGIKNKPADQPVLISQDIAGGSNKAILTLANGAKISITDAANGELVKEAGVVISKTADGQLIYKVTGGEKSSKVKKTAYNTIETPRGGQHQVLLPDGTRVWLNAASSIRFPEVFTNVDIRSVELKGEAYFEVSKDKDHPFVVKTARQQIEVLGTHFNVNSYSDEQKSVTTLLEGSVKVAPIGYQNGTMGTVLHNLSSIIKPGQQFSSSDNAQKVSAADTDQVLDWKNGDFNFKKETLSGIMRKVSRWYDVNVEYDRNVDLNQTFSGLVSRSKNISEVLKIMQSAGQLKFDINGKKVTVTR